ncbi:kelch repeat-containing protein [Methanoregula sp.]|uniref:Kelch repeat-containing protein n=1 Tax=Methanoregula sp. TaxID=2052170 RepID=UPI0035645091
MPGPTKKNSIITVCMVTATLLLLAGTACAATAPLAVFNGTPTSGTSPLTVTFADESTGGPTGWAWFFGDETYAQSWVRVNASSGLPARETQSAVALPDDTIVLTGGSGYPPADTEFNDTWQSADKGSTWTRVNPRSGWLARENHNSVALSDGSIVLFGGWGDVEFNDTWRSTDKGVTWTLMNASSGWMARESHASVVLSDDTIVLMGGWDDGSDLNDTWQSTDKGATWSLVNASSGWTARDCHTAVAMPDDSIVLMGGWGDTWARLNDTWRSTDKGVTWTLMNASSGWSQRSAHSSVALSDGSIVLMGGYNNKTKTLGDTWRSTDEGTTWTLMNAGSGWPKRDYHSSVALSDDSIVLMGGWNESSKRLSDTWRSMDKGATWTLVNTGSVGQAREYQAAVALFDGSIVLTGGSNGALLRDTWRSTDKGATWALMNASSGWAARENHNSVVLPDDSIVLLGGWGSSKKHLNDTWRSTDKGATWALMNASSGWPARENHNSVVLSDGSIVLFGGWNNVTDLNDTWRSTDKGATWTLMNASSGWAARESQASVVLSDDTIVLMGGWDGDNDRNDTWQSTDKGATWTLVNPGSGWTARDGHSAVAMPDDSIILLGGWGDTWSKLNDMWRSTDKGVTWKLVNADSGWAARSFHSSVVLPDGSIVLMRGYDDYDTLLGDTWRLQPAGSSEENPSHTYSAAGTYPVTLQVSNAGGHSSLRKNGYITVTMPGQSGSDSSGSSGVGGSTATTVSGVVAGQPTIFTFNQVPGVTAPVALDRVQITFSESPGTVEVTGMPVSSGGSPPGQTVIGYFAIEPVGINQNTVTEGVISFAVNGEWLASHNLDPALVTLMRNHDNRWVLLPTTQVSRGGDTYHYEATTPDFSYFAVVVQTSGTTANTTEIPASSRAGTPRGQVVTTGTVPATPVQHTVTTVPATTATTAVLSSPGTFTGLPVLVIAGIAGIVAVAGGIFLVRRWWIRRQNPALFRKYD